MSKHRDYWVTERKDYYFRRREAKAEQKSKGKDERRDTLVLIIDSADQNNHAIPYLFTSEEIRRYPVRITGVIAHGLTDPFFAFINTRWRGDTNTNLHCLIRVLDKVSVLDLHDFR